MEHFKLEMPDGFGDNERKIESGERDFVYYDASGPELIPVKTIRAGSREEADELFNEDSIYDVNKMDNIICGEDLVEEETGNTGN